MTIDQIIYEPVGTPKEQYGITVRSADFGQVSADVDKALAGETVHLTITPEEGYGLKALNVVNSVYYTQGKTIPFEEDATEVSFVMPDNDVTIQPVFYDKAAIYELDYSEVANGALPVGWRTTDGSDVRDYPSQNGSGPRTFACRTYRLSRQSSLLAHYQCGIWPIGQLPTDAESRQVPTCVCYGSMEGHTFL